MKFILALTKEYIIDNQPIGKKLFREFCKQNQTYDNYYKFIEEIVTKNLSTHTKKKLIKFVLKEKYELAEDDKLNELAQEIIKKYLVKNVNIFFKYGFHAYIIF